MTPEIRRELQGLLSALCDSTLAAKEQERLEQLLKQDDECVREYLEYLDVHARLILHPGFGAGRIIPDGGAGPRQPTRQRRLPQTLGYVLVSTATLAASLLLQVYWHERPEPDPKVTPRPAVKPMLPAAAYVATLTSAQDCAWEGRGEALRVGARLAPSVLRLQKGVARIHFDGGPDLVVEGPAEFRLKSANAAAIISGKVLFHGDETAAVFDLDTPWSTLVDLGTDYAVAVSLEGEEVHVFGGEVERTPRMSNDGSQPEHLKEGEARRYASSAVKTGVRIDLDPKAFARELDQSNQPPADSGAGLLAYEGFAYRDPWDLRNGKGVGGSGWIGAWLPGLTRSFVEGERHRVVLDTLEGLSRPRASASPVGGSFDFIGFAKYHRQLATPVRLDTDGVYYLSFLFRRAGPQADELNALAVLLRTSDEFKHEDTAKRLNIGIGGPNQLFTHLHRIGVRAPIPLAYGTTYLMVAKIVASAANPDQVLMRVYGPDDPVERDEPGSWTLTGPPFHSDLVFDWVEVHVNSKTRQTLDELRLGTTWSSVTAPWIGTAPPAPRLP
jgi:hypothetical protein